jgi:hypothetical protein
LSSYPYITIVSFNTLLFRIIENEIRQVYPSMTWFQLDMKKRLGPLTTSLYVDSEDEIEQLQVLWSNNEIDPHLNTNLYNYIVKNGFRNLPPELNIAAFRCWTCCIIHRFLYQVGHPVLYHKKR